MKTKNLLLAGVCLILSLYSTAQNTERSVLSRYYQSPSLTTYNAPLTPMATLQSPEAYHYAEWSVGADGSMAQSRPYKRAQLRRKTGLILLGAGGGSMVLSAVLLTHGVLGLKRGSNYRSYAYVGNVYEVYFGALLGLAGITVGIPGAVMAGRNAKRMRDIAKREGSLP